MVRGRRLGRLGRRACLLRLAGVNQTPPLLLSCMPAFNPSRLVLTRFLPCLPPASPAGDLADLTEIEPAAQISPGGDIYGAEGLLVNANDTSYFGSGSARSWFTFPSIRLPPSGNGTEAPGEGWGGRAGWQVERWRACT